jgi:GNAT superfamily N-acetyltransferase
VIFIIQRFDLLSAMLRTMLLALTRRGGRTRRTIREAPGKITAVIRWSAIDGLLGWSTIERNGSRHEMIVGVFVRRWARGHGIGRALVMAAAREAKRLHPRFQVIGLARPGSRARRFFDHLRRRP